MQKFEPLLEIYFSHVKKYIDILKLVEEKQLVLKNGESWSICELVNHLINVEKAFVNNVLKNREKVKLTNFRTIINYSLLRLVLNFPKIKIKIAKKINITTSNESKKEDLITDWEKANSNLKKLIKESENLPLNRVFFKHPLAGFLNTKQSLQFLIDHIKHHDRQLIKLIKRA